MTNSPGSSGRGTHTGVPAEWMLNLSIRATCSTVYNESWIKIYHREEKEQHGKENSRKAAPLKKKISTISTGRSSVPYSKRDKTPAKHLPWLSQCLTKMFLPAGSTQIYSAFFRTSPFQKEQTQRNGRCIWNSFGDLRPVAK